MTNVWAPIEVSGRTIRFKNHIFLLTFAIALPLILLAVGLTAWTAAERRAEQLQGLISTSHALQVAIDGELRLTAVELETLATCPDLDAAFASAPGSPELAATYARTTALVRQRPGSLLNVVLLDPDGRLILNTLAPFSNPPPDESDHSPDAAGIPPMAALANRWPKVLANRGVTLTPLFRGPVAKQNLVGMLLPVRRDDRVIGVLAVGLLPASLGRTLQNVQFPNERAAAIVDQDGNIITRSFNESEIIGTRASPQLIEFQRGTRAEDLVEGKRPNDGTLVYAALSRSSVAPWVLAYATPRTLVDMPVWHAVAAAAGVGAVAMGFALIGAWALGWRMNRDMQGLISAAMALSQPGRDIPVQGEQAPRVYEIAVARATFARAFEALREGEARLQLALDIARLGVWEWDLVRMQARHDIVSSRISGGILPADQWFAECSDEVRTWIEHTHPDDRAARQNALDDVRAGRSETCDITTRMRVTHGQWQWFRMHGAVVGASGRRLVGVVQDVTVQKDAEAELERLVAARTAALAEAEARFREVFDLQFEFIALLTPDGTVEEINRTALEACGLMRDHVIGRPLWEIKVWPAAERGNIRNEVAKAITGALIRREVEILGADERVIRIDLSLKAVRNAATGAVVSIIAEGHDLTEKHILTNQLAQVQKVQALGQLAGGIAHDFNNILQAISGAAMLIERHADDRAKIHHLTRMMTNAASRGTSITQRLLSFARRGELREEAIDTAGLLGNVREVLAHTLGTAIAVHVNLPPAVPLLLADRGQLDTALINLGANARDAMPDGGRLVFSAEAERVVEDELHIASLSPGKYVRLDVIDDGQGMDPATLARVTEPFFTTKPPGAGTGLGLAMVKGFAEQSGGGLAITSTPGFGTTVSLWLRQAVEKIVPPRRVNEDLPNVATATSARVLLVDDDDLVRETLADQLEDAGFAVLVAASGHEALALVTAGEHVDVLISDLSMPGLNGVTTIQKARELRPGLPCFLLTGYFGDRAALAAENSFILVHKPVAMADLAAQIEARLEVAHH